MTPPTLMMVTRPPREDERPLEETVAAAVAGGVDAVVLRDKTAPEKNLIRTAERLRPVLRGRARLFVHGSEDAARAAGADGWHSAADALATTTSERAAVLPCGFSVHSVDEARRAADRGAEYLLGGTIFSSSSHPGIPPIGIDALRALCAATSRPVVAIGGVVPENAAECLRAGARGVAALSPFMDAADPEAAAKKYRAALGASRPFALTVNGRAAFIPEPLSIAEFLRRRDLRAEMVAVEHNLEIVPRSRYAEVQLGFGDTLEIVQMMAGG